MALSREHVATVQAYREGAARRLLAMRRPETMPNQIKDDSALLAAYDEALTGHEFGPYRQALADGAIHCDADMRASLIRSEREANRFPRSRQYALERRAELTRYYIEGWGEKTGLRMANAVPCYLSDTMESEAA